MGYFDGFDGVFDLKDASFGREGVDSAIIVAPAWVKLYFVLNMFDITSPLNFNLKNIQIHIQMDSTGPLPFPPPQSPHQFIQLLPCLHKLPFQFSTLLQRHRLVLSFQTLNKFIEDLRPSLLVLAFLLMVPQVFDDIYWI